MALSQRATLLSFLFLLAAIPLSAASFDPSIEITGFVGTPSNTCNSGTPFGSVNILFNESNPVSDDLLVTAPGNVTVYNWTYASASGGENNGPASGPNTYGLGASALTVAAGTPLTATIRTYYAPNGGGGLAYTSAITWNCTTGAVLGIVNNSTTIPALSPVALALLGLALGGAGFVAASRLS